MREQLDLVGLEPLRRVAVLAALPRGGELADLRDHRPVVRGQDSDQLVDTVPLGLDLAGGAGGHVAIDARHVRMRRAVPGFPLGLHRLVAGGAAERRRVHVRDRLLAGEREEPDVGERGDGDEDDPPPCGAVVEGCLERRLQGVLGALMGAAAVEIETEGDEQEPDRERDRQRDDHQQALVRIGARGGKPDHQEKEDGEARDGADDRAEQRDPVCPEARKQRREAQAARPFAEYSSDSRRRVRPAPGGPGLVATPTITSACARTSPARRSRLHPACP